MHNNQLQHKISFSGSDPSVNVVNNVAPAAHFYVAWLCGCTKKKIVDASKVRWNLSTDKLKGSSGKVKVKNVGAYARGKNKEQLGGASGTFTGVISKTSTGYTAVGTFKPNNQPYDFDFWKGGSLERKAATFVGFVGGVAWFARTGIMPRNYEVEFTGDSPVEVSW